MPLSLFLTGFPTPCQHHPFLPPLLPTIAERQSTERSQFEHASLRITKGLSVRRFHPRRRFLFSFLRAPSGLTLSPSLFLFLFLVFPLFSPLSFSLSLSLHSSLFYFLAFIPNDRRFVSSSSAARSTFQVDTARTRQTDASYRRRGIVIRRAVYVLSQSQTSQRDGTLADQRIATTHRLIGG